MSFMSSFLGILLPIIIIYRIAIVEAESDLNQRPHGCEPSGLKPLPRTSRILDFANRVVNLKVGSRVDYGWVLNPSLVQFFTRIFVPGNASYQSCGH